MSVGGRILEMVPMKITAGPYPGKPTDVVRIAVVDGIDETCIFAEPAEIMPKLGDNIWWQAGEIYFDNDRRRLRKVAYSFTAPWASAKGE